MSCVECGQRPRHKRYHRCRECMTWKWSLTSRKGLLKRQQLREGLAAAAILVALTIPGNSQIPGPNISPDGVPYTFSPRFGYLGPPAPMPPRFAYAPLPLAPPPPPLGWIYGPYTVCADPPRCGAIVISVGADGLNFRFTPNGPVLGALANGTPVIPLGRDGNWMLVAAGCALAPTYTWSITSGVPLSVCL